MLIHQLIEYISKGENFLIATIFGVINMLIRPPKESVFAYLVEYFISVAVAIISGFLCEDFGLSTGMTFALVAISALIARDVVTMITGFGSFINTHRDTLYNKLLAKLTSKLDNTENKE